MKNSTKKLNFSVIITQNTRRSITKTKRGYDTIQNKKVSKKNDEQLQKG